MDNNLPSGLEFLAKQGLPLFAALPCTNLPADIMQTFAAEKIDLQPYHSLVLLGNAGPKFWPALTKFGMKTTDPVDYFSRVLAQQFIDRYLNAASSLILYPQEYNIPLQTLGTLAGWHHPSPLGIGINATYGLWFAYRVVFLTAAPLPDIRQSLGPSPCDACPDTPCLTACPAQAVQGINKFNMPACFDFRLQENSLCQDYCLSRLACPIAPEYQYPLEQFTYHYTHALASIKPYL